MVESLLAGMKAIGARTWAVAQCIPCLDVKSDFRWTETPLGPPATVQPTRPEQVSSQIATSSSKRIIKHRPGKANVVFDFLRGQAKPPRDIMAPSHTPFHESLPNQDC